MKKTKMSLTGILTVLVLVMACWYVGWLTDEYTRHPHFPRRWPGVNDGPPQVILPNTTGWRDLGKVYMVMSNEINGQPS